MAEEARKDDEVAITNTGKSDILASIRHTRSSAAMVFGRLGLKAEILTQVAPFHADSSEGDITESGVDSDTQAGNNVGPDTDTNNGASVDSATNDTLTKTSVTPNLDTNLSRSLKGLRLFRQVLTPEQELELLMGRALHINNSSSGDSIEVIFNKIFELLSKNENAHLRHHPSQNFKRTAIELAMDCNNARNLDNHIAGLMKLGCTYSSLYEKKLPAKLRANNLNNLAINEDNRVSYRPGR